MTKSTTNKKKKKEKKRKNNYVKYISYFLKKSVINANMQPTMKMHVGTHILTFSCSCIFYYQAELKRVINEHPTTLT